MLTLPAANLYFHLALPDLQNAPVAVLAETQFCAGILASHDADETDVHACAVHMASAVARACERHDPGCWSISDGKWVRRPWFKALAPLVAEGRGVMVDMGR